MTKFLGKWQSEKYMIQGNFKQGLVGLWSHWWKTRLGAADWESGMKLKPIDLGWGLGRWGCFAASPTFHTSLHLLVHPPGQWWTSNIPNPADPIKAQRRNKVLYFLTNPCCTLVVRHSRVPGFPSLQISIFIIWVAPQGGKMFCNWKFQWIWSRLCSSCFFGVLAPFVAG